MSELKLPALQGSQIAKGNAPMRQSQPTNPSTVAAGYQFVPRRWQGYTQEMLLSYQGMRPETLLDMLADLNGDVHLALWNTLRMVGRGLKIEVRPLDDSQQDEEGQRLADQIASMVNVREGGISSLLDNLVFALYVYGGCAVEVVPDLRRGQPFGVIDWFAVHPDSIRASRDPDDLQRVVFYQQRYNLAGGTNNTASTNGALGYTRLNPTTFFYSAFDAAPDDPYGRSPIRAALSHVFADIRLLQDLGRWVHVNAWGHFVAEVDAEKLLKLVPPNVAADPVEFDAWMKAEQASALTSLRGMQPEDVASVPSFITVRSIRADSTGFNVEPVSRLIERKLIRDLKQLPVLMGSNEGTTETHSTVQWEIYSAGISSLQRKIAHILEQAFTVSLRLYGHPAIVRVSFASVRASDRLSDAQAAAIELSNAATKRDQGWQTQDEASLETTGTPAVVNNLTILPAKSEVGADLGFGSNPTLPVARNEEAV